MTANIRWAASRRCNPAVTSRAVEEAASGPTLSASLHPSEMFSSRSTKCLTRLCDSRRRRVELSDLSSILVGWPQVMGWWVGGQKELDDEWNQLFLLVWIAVFPLNKHACVCVCAWATLHRARIRLYHFKAPFNLLSLLFYFSLPIWLWGRDEKTG